MRIRALPTVIATALALALPAGAQAAVAGHVRVAIDSNPSIAASSQNTARSAVVILQPWQTGLLGQLKASDPGIKVLAYKNLGFISETASYSGISASGVTWPQAQAHEGWFLHDKAGKRFASWTWKWLWAADIGDPTYQQAFADNVIAELKETGFDGVMLDDVSPTIKFQHDPGDVQEYSGDASYGRAMSDAIGYVGPRIQAAGKLVVANVASWTEYSSVTTPWLDDLSGMLDEMFTKWGNRAGEGYSDQWQWERELAQVKDAEAKNKLFLGVAHGPASDRAAARFGWATTLLAGAGHSYFQVASDYTNEYWFPEFDYAIGEPTGAESRIADGVHRRTFTNGLVVVNPTASDKSVSFGGSYSGSGLSGATGATLGAHCALILTRDGGNAGSPSPTKGRSPRSSPSARRASSRLSVLATSASPGSVSVTWTRSKSGRRIGRYRVFRDGRLVGTTHGRRWIDRAPVPGATHRYSVAAVTRSNRMLRASRAVAVHIASAAAAQASAGGAVSRGVQTRLAAYAPRLFRAQYAERLVTAHGRAHWRRITRVKRPRSAATVRVTAPAGALVRIVLVPRASGPALRSAALAY
ncbi:MAG TPA: putative glycoside hydrolase [Thermoleophilaceae bacterium]